ncbi:MAG: ATP synthase subunit I [Peptococcaceae bacterium]
MIRSIMIGFILGLGVSILNHRLTVSSLNNIAAGSRVKKRSVLKFILRYFLNLAVLFLVHKNPPMLIAAAFGLTMVKNFILIQYTLGKKNLAYVKLWRRCKS